MGTAALGQFAHIGKSVCIKGELSGSEDIYIDGQVEGSVQLGEGSLTVGASGRVHANIVAKNVTVGGILDGNIQAAERTEIRRTAVVNGDVQTRRIAIEEGAYFKGRLEILSDGKTQAGSGAAAVAASSAASRIQGNSEPRK
jgi:cytoskeletal protein CcmA (bactofilin family)